MRNRQLWFGSRPCRVAQIAACLATLALAVNSGLAQQPVNPLRQSPPPASGQAKKEAPPSDAAEKATPQATPESAGDAAGTPSPLTPEPAAANKTGVDAIYELTKTAKTLDEYSNIIHLCQTARQADPTRDQEAYLRQLAAWAFNRRGEAWIERGSSLTDSPEARQEADQRALADFESAIQADPNRWKALHNRGVSRAIAEQLPGALEDFNRVVELQPQYANVWFNRAEVLYELGRVGEAEQDYLKSLEQRPEDAAARTGLAHCRFQQGRLQEAITDYSEVVALLPQDVNALTNRAEAYQAAGQWEQAAVDYRAILTTSPESSRPLASAAWFMATCPEARYRAQAKALELAEKALAVAPAPTIRLLDVLAAAQANLGQFPQAVQNLEDARQLPGANSTGLSTRLELYRQGQPYRQAAAAIGLASNPNNY